MNEREADETQLNIVHDDVTNLPEQQIGLYDGGGRGV